MTESLTAMEIPVRTSRPRVVSDALTMVWRNLLNIAATRSSSCSPRSSR